MDLTSPELLAKDRAKARGLENCRWGCKLMRVF
jgi:hypothetical protein